jgi:hypothetical protein
MSKPEMVCWWVEFDKAGKPIRRLFRPAEKPQPQLEPATTTVRRGVVQGTLI